MTGAMVAASIGALLLALPGAQAGSTQRALLAVRYRAAAPVSDADTQSMGDTGYPCPASGEFIKHCAKYEKWIQKNREVPKSLKEPYIYGGTKEFHNGDPEMRAACKNNYNIICVKKNPLCEEYFSYCD